MKAKKITSEEFEDQFTDSIEILATEFGKIIALINHLPEQSRERFLGPNSALEGVKRFLECSDFGNRLDGTSMCAILRAAKLEMPSDEGDSDE